MSADQFISENANIHQTAVIAPGAKIAENVEIGPYSVIGEHVEIGEGTKIGPHVVIHGWTEIGRECRIFQGASIGEEPQDLKFKGERVILLLVIVRQSVRGQRFIGQLVKEKKPVSAMTVY